MDEFLFNGNPEKEGTLKPDPGPSLKFREQMGDEVVEQLTKIKHEETIRFYDKMRADGYIFSQTRMDLEQELRWMSIEDAFNVKNKKEVDGRASFFCNGYLSQEYHRDHFYPPRQMNKSHFERTIRKFIEEDKKDREESPLIKDPED